MYGYMNAVEVRVHKDQMIEWLAEYYDGDSLEYIGSVRSNDDRDEDRDWQVTSSRGELTVSTTVSAQVSLDITEIETRYRESYLADIETGDIDTPALCSWTKTRRFVDDYYVFTYVNENSLLSDATGLVTDLRNQVGNAAAREEALREQRDTVFRERDEARAESEARGALLIQLDSWVEDELERGNLTMSDVAAARLTEIRNGMGEQREG